MIDSLAPGSEVGNTSESVQPVAKETPSPRVENPVPTETQRTTIEATSRVEEDQSARIAQIQEQLQERAPEVVVGAPKPEERAAEVVLNQATAEAGSPTKSEMTDSLTILQRARREALHARHGGSAA